MQRSGVTFEEVVTAANHIRSQGQNPTIEKIRLHIGSGSNTTINKYLKVWRDQHQILGESEHTADWSNDIVKMAAEQVWTGIRKEAEEKIAMIKEEAQQSVQVAQHQLSVARNKMESLEAELTQLRDDLNSEMAAKALQALELKKLTQEHGLLKERYLGLEQRFTDCEQLFDKNLAASSAAHANETQRLEEKNASLQKNHEILITEIKTQHETLRHQAMVALDETKEEKRKLNLSISHLNEKLHQKELQLAELQATLKVYLQEREASIQSLSQMPHQLDEIKRSLSNQALSNQCEAIDYRIMQLQQSNEKDLSVMMKELKNLQCELKKIKRNKKAVTK